VSEAGGRRISLLGCPIDALDMQETVACCDELVQRRGYTQHIAINVAKLVSMDNDAALREIVDGCALINADGQGIVWAAKLLGRPLPERVAGIDLMMELMGLAELRGYRVYVLGAKPDVLDRAIAILRERHPALVFAGWRDGYFSADEEAGVCADIRASGADLLFVAMSTPRKEFFLAERGPELGVPFAMGVGGAIDVVAGVTRRAPVLWQKAGMEWAYRLLQEPRRMWRRYAVTNSRFALLLLRALISRPSS
jgi:N-acetylglucosaminyldiphosphoundecaprenol N-acetyl-beta-D-mannosaminyltransferase